ncbi:MAG TPA: site-2 protease family protein [Gemmatales bacterium]|mgnify:CR=1 FL=1|nr:site-2 protease family protein [Gemmatales bacterium]HMP58963.1 site-2 protease family protein [Gemmatales bacterium]
MGWSWRIGRVLGIDVYLHFTFLLLLAWLAWRFYTHAGPWGVLLGLAYVAGIFGIIVLHELGHALAARNYGIPTLDITLLPIGGVARLERMPEDPRQELVVAIAGPLVNVIIACGLVIGMALAGTPLRWSDLANPAQGLVTQFVFLNGLLVAFNLLPAFPMDGGRVLRALLALRMDYVRATQIAATIGQAAAVVFGLVGLFTSYHLLLFTALFVWLGADAEASMARMRSSLTGIPIQRAMQTAFQVVSPDQTISEVLTAIISGYQRDFPVVTAEGKLVGVLSRDDVLQALAEKQPQARVADRMQTDFLTANPRDMLQAVLARCQEHDCDVVPVVERDQLVGMVSADRLGEFLMVESALRDRRHD